MTASEKDEILAAIAGLGDRLAAVESRLTAVEEGNAKALRSLEDSVLKSVRTIEKLDRKTNAIARKLLSGAECVSLGITDARTDASPSSHGPSSTPAHP